MSQPEITEIEYQALVKKDARHLIGKPASQKEWDAIQALQAKIEEAQDLLGVVPCRLTPGESYVTAEEAAGYYASLPRYDFNPWQEMFMNAPIVMNQVEFKKQYECQWPTEGDDCAKR